MKKLLASFAVALALSGCGVSKTINEDALADANWVLADAAIPGHSQAFVPCATQLKANAAADLAAPTFPATVAILSGLQKAEDEKASISALIQSCSALATYDPLAYAQVLGAVGLISKLAP